MKKLIIFLVLFCKIPTLLSQNYISFNKEIIKSEENFILNDCITEITNVKSDSYKFINSNTRISKLSGMEHSTYLIKYGNIPLDFSSFNIHKKNGIIASINGNISIIHNIDTIPNITAQEALRIAIDYVHADSYSWQVKPYFLSENKDTQYLLMEPIPFLVICPDFKSGTKTPELAYKVEIFSIEPFMHQYVYVNADNGKIIHVQPLMKNLNGIAETRYSGTQTISTSYVNNLYNLIDLSRGNGIYTYVIDPSNNQSSMLTDNDNMWTFIEYYIDKRNAALDAHWGAIKTYDFFKEKYNRNSIDDNGMVIHNIVNCPDLGNNARWDNITHILYYGTGDFWLDAVTSLDVVAHELGHGITYSCQSSMLYEGETGAINESFSDIWGACVEYYAAPNKQHWWIGEDIVNFYPALRYMDNPKQGGDPDTYLGTYYLDPAIYSADSVVHHNSGITNHWFFLLSDGGIGVNDNGYSYSIEGIGIDEASDIVYESLNYLQNEMSFSDFAVVTRNVADNLYGMCADETINLIEAWKAVGISFEDIPEVVNITETLNTGNSKTYFAYSLLTASNIVQNGATEILLSPTKIVLAPGFRAELGSLVRAQIEPCYMTSNREQFFSVPKIESSNIFPIYNSEFTTISVSPNPARDEIVISGIPEECKYIIYDSTGKIVKSGVLCAPYTINVAQLLYGTYLLAISINDVHSHVKFIKQ